jgi:hypothetical protein
MVFEAYAGAITTIAKRFPNSKAILTTFVNEMQDCIEKEFS